MRHAHGTFDHSGGFGGDTKARARCRSKFLKLFPKGFHDPRFLAWERDYKWEAHERWMELLGPKEFAALLEAGEYAEVAQRAVRVETRTNLLFSFEKMALRDAIRSPDGARVFARALHQWLHGPRDMATAFEHFTEAVDGLPRKQTRVLTWPLITVFGFLAQPERHIFLKPQLTRVAAKAYDFPLLYTSRPAWPTYEGMLDMTEQMRTDLADLGPRDLIDIQSFIFVLGSPYYG